MQQISPAHKARQVTPYSLRADDAVYASEYGWPRQETVSGLRARLCGFFKELLLIIKSVESPDA